MNLIMSIKSEYVNKIKKGIKKYEFRRQYIKKYKDIDKVFAYETSPTKSITMILKFEDCLINTPQKIWELCSEHAGINKKDFFKYYKGKKNSICL